MSVSTRRDHSIEKYCLHGRILRSFKFKVMCSIPTNSRIDRVRHKAARNCIAFLLNSLTQIAIICHRPAPFFTWRRLFHRQVDCSTFWRKETSEEKFLERVERNWRKGRFKRSVHSMDEIGVFRRHDKRRFRGLEFSPQRKRRTMQRMCVFGHGINGNHRNSIDFGLRVSDFGENGNSLGWS